MNMFDAVLNLIDKVKTKYFMFLIDDVCQIVKKDFVTPIIQYMESNERVIQVKYGGGIISEGHTNISNLLINNDNVAFTKSPKTVFTRNKIHNDTIWTFDIAHQNIKEEFIFSYYNCIMRTKVFQQINDIINLNQSNNVWHKRITWSDYLAYINYSPNTCNQINKLGFPAPFKFLENYQTGWLNFCNYIFAIDRGISDVNAFIKTHTKEIK